MRATHIVPLDILRSEPTLVKEIARGSFVQVLRADMFATLRNGKDGHPLHAYPGLVFFADKGVYAENKGFSPNAFGGISQRGVLILASYESSGEILPFATSDRPVGTRLLGSTGIDNANINMTLDVPDSRHMAVIHGFGCGYSAAPAAGARVAVIIEKFTATGTEQGLYNAWAPRNDWRDVWFPYPLIARPGYSLIFRLSASGTAGVLATVNAYGEVISI